MSRPHRGRFETWLRGGQTAHHTFDMTLEVLGWLSLIGAGWFLLCVYLLWNGNAATRGAGGLTLWAWVCQQIGDPFPQVINIKPIDQVSVAVPVSAVWRTPEVAVPARLFWGHAIQWSVFFLGGCILIGIGASRVFNYVGRDKVKTRQIRGQEITRLSDLIQQIHAFNAATVAERNGVANTPVKAAGTRRFLGRENTAELEAKPAINVPALAGVPYPLESEMQHTMVVGAPGSGKTEAIHQLIDTIRQRGQRAIIFDPELDFIRAHHQEGRDVILNPFDARSPGWSPFDDALDRPDWDKLGHAIFKDPKSGDPYWVEVARSLFSWTGYQLRRRNPNIELTEALDLLFGPTRKLKELLEGTPAAKHLNGLEGARVSSLESVLTNGVEPLIYLYGSKARFSIREWTNRETEDGGFLFLSTPESHMDSIRPLLGFWSEIAIGAMLSRHEIARTPTWIILDEFHSAGKIEKLADGPQRLRKYGGAVVLGFQQISQLQDLYGPDKSRTIIGQCQTKLILRAGDRDTAEVMSEQIGRRVMRRVEENTSYGANSIRDGVGLTPKEELEPILLPEDVYNLPALEGIIRVSNVRRSGPFPIAPIKIAYIPRDKRTPGFVPKPTDPVDDYLNRLRQGFDSRDTPAAEASAGAPSAGASTGGRSLERSDDLIGLRSALPSLPPTESSTGPSSKAPDETPPDRARRAMGDAPAKIGALRRVAGSGAPTEAADTTAAGAVATASAAGLSPAMQLAADSRRGGAADEDDVADRDIHLTPRPVDLPTVQAEMLRRREEAEESTRMEKAHTDRRHDASDPNRPSVWQRERDILIQADGDRGLEIGETVTAGEIDYAEHHRHQAFDDALGLVFSGVVGATLDPAQRHASRHGRSAEETGAEAPGSADLELAPIRRTADEDSLDTPNVEDVLVLEAASDPGVHAEAGPPGKPDRAVTFGSDPRLADRAKRLLQTDLFLVAESDRDRDGAPDRDPDRDMQLTR